MGAPRDANAILNPTHSFCSREGLHPCAPSPRDEWGCPPRTLLFGKTEGCSTFYEVPSVFDQASKKKAKATIGKAARLTEMGHATLSPGPGAYQPRSWSARPSSTKGSIGPSQRGARLDEWVRINSDSNEPILRFSSKSPLAPLPWDQEQLVDSLRDEFATEDSEVLLSKGETVDGTLKTRAEETVKGATIEPPTREALKMKLKDASPRKTSLWLRRNNWPQPLEWSRALRVGAEAVAPTNLIPFVTLPSQFDAASQRSRFAGGSFGTTARFKERSGAFLEPGPGYYHIHHNASPAGGWDSPRVRPWLCRKTGEREKQKKQGRLEFGIWTEGRVECPEETPAGNYYDVTGATTQFPKQSERSPTKEKKTRPTSAFGTGNRFKQDAWSSETPAPGQYTYSVAAILPTSPSVGIGPKDGPRKRTSRSHTHR